MLTAILFALVLTPPADDAAAALALAKAGRDRKPAPVVAALTAEEAAYSVFRRDVAAGASGVLFVGEPVPTGFSEYRITCSVAAFAGVDPGAYQCDLVGGKAVMTFRRPRPAFATPVRNLIYQFAPRSCAGGNCPR